MLSRRVEILLRVVRVIAVLAVLFGVGAAGSGFESQPDYRGRDSGVIGGGLMALVGLKRPPDGEMFPVWIGRLCVVLGILVAVALTRVLDRHKRQRAGE